MTAKQFSAYMLIYEREYVLPNPAAPTPAPTAAMPPSSQRVEAPASSVFSGCDVGSGAEKRRGNGLAVAAREELVAGEGGKTLLGGREKEWEPPWSGVPRPSELVPSSVFQVSSTMC